MRIKKRYVALSIALSIVALVIAAAVFYFEMCLSHFMKYNDVMSTTWHETSRYEPYNGSIMDTQYHATKVESVADHNKNAKKPEDRVKPYAYFGDVTVVSGKYLAYGRDVFGSNLIVYGDPRNKSDLKRDTTSDGKVRDFSVGSSFTVYYKPDNPRMLAAHVNVVPYIVIIAILIVISVPIIVVCRLLNNKLNENTFSDKAVNIMDIPIVVVVGGIIIGFFGGMLFGTLSIGSDYTEINQSIAEQYESGSLTI
ncbi:MAG: hypothetical protein IJ080_05315 [Oscillospiraceae bacterium]|nr:hypothetical protein [Oscillospiraceae bacterium]MBQ8979167.1 hypothetical protein [Oscillospiraceae bacterium]